MDPLFVYRAEHAPTQGCYKGCLENGKSGYFDPLQTAPYIDIQASPALRQGKTKMSRKGKNFNYKTDFVVVVVVSF